MLVLSRQRDQVIHIGDDIEITVCDIRGDKVRLGVTCPRHVEVDRSEVRSRKNRDRGRRMMDMPDYGEGRCHRCGNVMRFNGAPPANCLSCGEATGASGSTGTPAAGDSRAGDL